MVKKFKLIFLLSLTILMILGTTSFANVTMTEEIAQQIINFYGQNLNSFHTSNGKPATQDALNFLKSIDANNFATIFNNNFNNYFSDYGNYNFHNITISAVYMGKTNANGYQFRFDFYLGNNSFSDSLEYLKLTQDSENSYLIKFKNETSAPRLMIRISEKTTPLINFLTSSYETYYFSNENFFEITGDESILGINSLLAMTPAQIVYFSELDSEYEKGYFIKNNLNTEPPIDIPDTPESGDIGESGDTGGGTTTPSGDAGGGSGGDTGSGTTNEKLDNINQNLNNIENVIESGNQEIVGEIGEVKDFLSGDTTITNNELLEKFPEVEIEDPSEDFFSWIFSQIENIFLSTEPQSFEFSLFTENKYTISSEQIKVPDNAIKTLVGLSASFGIFYWVLKDVRKTINKIKEGSIEALATEDITADMV